MKPSEYMELAFQTASPEQNTTEHYVLGICTEAGEVAHEAKAHLVYGKDLSRGNIIEELGDLAWYMSNMMRLHNTTWEEVWAANVEKLKKRYPGGFTKAAAIERADKSGE